MKSGTNTTFFLYRSKIPKGKKVIYCRIVLSMQLLKAEVYQVLVTVRGDRLEYSRSITSILAQFITTKIYLNPTISVQNTYYMTTNIKDFFYSTPM